MTFLQCPSCGGGGGGIIGHEVRGIYDGVLFWSCVPCDHAWPRSGFDGRRALAAQQHVDSFNSGAREAKK